VEVKKIRAEKLLSFQNLHSILDKAKTSRETQVNQVIQKNFQIQEFPIQQNSKIVDLVVEILVLAVVVFRIMIQIRTG
jgi:hypothetical protein